MLTLPEPNSSNLIRTIIHTPENFPTKHSLWDQNNAQIESENSIHCIMWVREGARDRPGEACSIKKAGRLVLA